jgi:hypothetical protein
MKYIVAVLPEKGSGKESDFIATSGGGGIQIRGGYDSPGQEAVTEEQAIQAATRLTRRGNQSVGIYKLVKQVDPPDVVIKDIED